MKITVNRKKKEKRGTGDGRDYKPFIKTREINSLGTCSNFVDWKTGRQMEFLSQTELFVYMQLRWQDDVLDIKEQYPLDWQKLNSLITELNAELSQAHLPTINKYYSEESCPTTDMLVLHSNNMHTAVSVKYDKHRLSKKEIESLWLEKRYWNNMGCEFCLLDRSDVNEILVKNLRLVTEYYNPDRIYDEDSLLKHLIATKQIYVPLDKEIINMQHIKQTLKGEIYAKLTNQGQ